MMIRIGMVAATIVGLWAATSMGAMSQVPDATDAMGQDDQINYLDPDAKITFEQSETPLVVETKGGETHAFSIEIARTRVQQSRGMMFRTEMADDYGMLFIYDRPKRRSFWMRNTLIPLDLIFVRSTGKIANIIHSAAPETLEQRKSVGRAIAVLELRGGRAKELGLARGDMIKHPVLGNVE